jgi:HAD superfamily, subfamily IIIB (Acid phosphatase)
VIQTMFPERASADVTLRRSVAVLAIIASFTLPAGAPAAAQDKPTGCDPMPGKVSLDATAPINMDPKAPINIGLLGDALIYYRCTDYDDQVKAVLNEASAWVAARAPGVDKPAIVLDIDETSLSNWEEIVHNKFSFIPSGACDIKAQSACGQREWELSARASAIRPTLDLFNMAQKLKGKNGEPVAIFFITGRLEDPFERMATEWNLRKVGYDNWRGLFMRPESSKDQPVSRHKTLSRIKIEATHTIIANVGDQVSDLSGDQNGDHAERCFKVPNPFYYIPGDAPPGAVLKCMAR